MRWTNVFIALRHQNLEYRDVKSVKARISFNDSDFIRSNAEDNIESHILLRSPCSPLPLSCLPRRSLTCLVKAAMLPFEDQTGLGQPQVRGVIADINIPTIFLKIISRQKHHLLIMDTKGDAAMKNPD